MTELMKKVTLSDIGVLFARVEKLEAVIASLNGAHTNGAPVPAAPESAAPVDAPAKPKARASKTKVAAPAEKPAVDVDAIMNELRVVVPALSSKDMPQAKAILARFDAQRVKDVKTEDLPALLKAFKEAL
jgi:hypothetical protein|nr:MAG TPA: hypothetical protein [Caudoviricetes sp.]